MPATPYMSPAAMGWMRVRPRGWPVAAKRSPSARNTASGQPRPLEELTVMVAPGRTSATASSAAMIRVCGMISLSAWSGTLRRSPCCRSKCRNGDAAAASGRFPHRERDGERPHAILSCRCRGALAARRGIEQAHRAVVQVFRWAGVDALLGGAIAAEGKAPDGILGHHVDAI